MSVHTEVWLQDGTEYRVKRPRQTVEELATYAITFIDATAVNGYGVCLIRCSSIIRIGKEMNIDLMRTY